MRCFPMRHSFDILLVMVTPTFVDLQGFTVGGRFIVKEIAVLRKGTVLSHYIFTSPIPWKFLTSSDKSCASWLIAYHHGLRWNDGMIPYSMAKRLITMAVVDTEENDDNDDKTFVYVKGLEKRGWLEDMLDSDVKNDVYIETIDARYTNMKSLNNFDVTNTIRCGTHVRNCAMQNVFKLFNWWSNYHKE